jgi:hypothetical protein
MPMGSPKYVKGNDPVAHPKVLARCTSFSLLMLMGTIIDLEKLILRPVESLKNYRIPFKKKSCGAEASRMMSVSSAY